jgi:heme exporter protein D
MTEFLGMGGYAWYVWGSYGVTFALIALEIYLLRERSKKAERQ